MPPSARSRPRSLADQLLAEAGQSDISAEEQSAAAEASFPPIPRALLIPIERIAPSSDNPRKSFDGLDELAASIAERGVLQTLIVRPDVERPGYYITVVGARRLFAARIVQGSEDAQSRARVAVLPCVVVVETSTDAFADALLENLARKDLSRAEVMTALLRLQSGYGWSARYIARRTGRSVSDVAELLSIAKDEEVASVVRDEIVTPTVAGQIQRLPKALRGQVLQRARSGQVTRVEDIRALRRQLQGAPSDTSAVPIRPISDISSVDVGIEDRSTLLERTQTRPSVSHEDIPGHGQESGRTERGALTDAHQEQVEPANSVLPPVPDVTREPRVSDIGHLAAGRDALPSMQAAAAEEVIRSISALVRCEGTLDPVTRRALQRAKDDLIHYLDYAADR